MVVTEDLFRGLVWGNAQLRCWSLTRLRSQVAPGQLPFHLAFYLGKMDSNGSLEYTLKHLWPIHQLFRRATSLFWSFQEPYILVCPRCNLTSLNRRCRTLRSRSPLTLCWACRRLGHILLNRSFLSLCCRVLCLYGRFLFRAGRLWLLKAVVWHIWPQLRASYDISTLFLCSFSWNTIEECHL